MNKEELLDNTLILNDKDIYEKLDKNKELRDWFLVELNVFLQNAERVVANLKDKKELRCYKNAVTSLEVENKKQKELIDKAIEWVRDWTHGKNDWFEEDSKPSELLEILKEEK